jgi:type I restriction enzyme, S subunit
MASEWLLTSIGDHVELLTGEAFKSSGFTESGVRLARGDNVKEGEFEWGDKTRYWPTVTADLERYLLRDGDVLLGMDGSKVGKNWVQVRPPDLPCLLVQRVARLRGKETLDQGFLRFLIGNPAFRDYVHRVRTGTSIPHISGGQIKSYEINLPPLTQQKRIAHILGTLDDKIELNSRMNATLEAMSRALFKSWFVDFDPVRQKAAGKQPVGMDAKTAALFPNSFEDSEIGEVPKGWEAGRWGDVATLEYGKGLRNYGGDRHKYTVFGTNGAIGTHDVALCSGPGIIVGRKGAYRGIHYSPNAFFVIDTAFYLRPLASMEMRWAYYELLRTNLNDIDSGSAIPSTSRESFYGIPVVVPPVCIQTSFVMATVDSHNLQLGNESKSRTLAALRDTLLPKLLSGEIRVPEAEQAVEEATA